MKLLCYTDTMKNKTITTSLLSAIVIIILFGSLLTPAFGRESIYERIKKNAIVDRTTVSSPLGYFLLMRKENTVCAIRFTNYQGSDSIGGGAGVFVSKASAEYDYFYQDDGSSDLKKENIDSGHSKLSATAVSSGNIVKNILIKCGSFELKWVGAGVYMSNQMPARDEIEFAPTKWRDINEVNFNDPRVTWYRVDFKRDLIEIPIDDLW